MPITSAVRSLSRGAVPLLAAGLATSGAAAPTAHAQDDATSDPEIIAATLRHIAENGHHPYLRWPDFPFYRDELEGLYGASGYGPLWFEGDRPTRQFRSAVDVLLDAESRGLNPANYDAATLDSLWNVHRNGGPIAPDQLALADAAVTVAILRHISDVHIGRVNPRNISIQLDIEPKKYDLAAVLTDAIARDRIEEAVTEAEPDFPAYWHLKAALPRYQALAELPPIGTLEGGMVRPGDDYPDLPRLRELLLRLGDLDETQAPPSASTAYGGAIAGAVARYQERHGLGPDSIIGPATLEELNTPMMDRVHQIEWGLERFRWLPDMADQGRFIAVNIPSFRLWAFDGLDPGGESALQMRVVVGRALNTQTPVFMERMRYLEFAPYWNVPYNIAVSELLPAARRDPEYLARNRYELVPDFSWTAPVLPPTEENLARVGSGTLNIRQQPGPANSLGLVKFIFPNASHVYLHSTPAPELFSRTRRDFSHGCVRVENPVGLASWVLADQRDREWTEADIRGAMNAGRPSRVNLARPIPVIIFYTTAAVQSDGRIYFWNDVYGHDEILEKALAQGYPYPP